MTKSLSTICLLIALLAAMGQVRADFLYSGSRDDNLLHVIDPSDASTLDAITLSLAGEDIVATRGLAAHPVPEFSGRCSTWKTNPSMNW